MPPSGGSPGSGAQAAERPRSRSSVTSGLHDAFSEVLQDCNSPTNGAKVVGAAQARQQRASALSQDERFDALFGQRVQGSASAPSLANLSRRSSGTSPMQRRGTQGSLGGGGSSAASPLRMGAGLTLGGRPFCAPRDDVGSLYLRVEAVKRNAERNRKELAANRAFMDEVHAIEASGKASRAQKRREAGLPEEDKKEQDPNGVQERQATLVHKRIEAMRENLQCNRTEIELNRRKLDEMLVFGGQKEAEVFDPVNFGKYSGLGTFALPAGGETSTRNRLDSMTSNLKRNEATLREHRAFLDGIQEAKGRGGSTQAPRQGAPAPEAAAPGLRRALPCGTTSPIRSLDVVRPTVSLASRLDAVSEAARSNALELRAFRGTIDEAQDAQRQDSEALAKTTPPVERIFCSGQLRPGRAAGPDRSKELKSRVEVLATNASRNFEQLSDQRQGLNQARMREEEDAAERKGRAKASRAASPARSTVPGFGVAM